MASAISRISFSSTSQAKVFQLFQPSGGVRPSCSNFLAEALVLKAKAINAADSSAAFFKKRSMRLSSFVVINLMAIKILLIILIILMLKKPQQTLRFLMRNYFLVLI